uniref:Uncharacterized protein n=1 Tax=Arion vulgaris TaxID=1028688 RepID=A0A0B7B850_9EUPU
MLKSTKDVSKKESAIASFVDNKTKSSQLTTNDSVKEKDVVDSESGGDASSRSLVKDEIGTTETSISKDYNDEKIKNVEGIEVSLTTTETIVTDIDNNTSKQESNEEVGAVCSSRDIKLTEPGYSSDVRHLANNTGRNYDAYTDVASSSNENLKETKNTEDFVRKGQEIEGDTSRSSSKNVKTDSVRNVGYQPGGNEKSQVVEGEYKSDTPVASLSSSQETTAVASTSTDITVTKSTKSNDSKPSSSIHQTTSTSDEQDKEQDSPCVQSSLQKFNHLEDISKKDDSISDTKSQFSVSLLERGQRDGSVDSRKDETEKVSAHDRNIIESLSDEIKKKDENLFDLTQQLYTMEEKVKLVEEERDILRKTSLQTEEFEQIEKESMWTQEESIETQIEDTEKLLNDLRSQLSKMEEQCFRLEKDNRSLHDKLQTQEVCVKRDQASRGKNNDNVVLEEDLEAAEKELEDVKEENKELQSHIMEMKNEMNEMYDHFRESEHDEFREIQKELDIAAKNCRILQFKLRKAERRNDQVEQDRIHYEDKLRTLQDQFDSQDAKNHIRALEEELRMAKEVSVRLHDELDVVEDKRNKALEENRHLTDLLEHTDKRQFRMEMEIDKLRDIVSDLQQQLKEAKGSNNNKESTPDRKVLSSIYTRSID